MPAPGAFEGAVRPYQLPDNAPSVNLANQYNLAAEQYVVVTPGFGASGAGQLPPIQMGAAHYDQTVTTYQDQAAVETTTASEQ